MTRKMTLVFHDEELYTQLKIEAVKRRTTASEIVAFAVREWMENCEDAVLAPMVREASAEWREKGGKNWDEVVQALEEPGETRENI